VQKSDFARKLTEIKAELGTCSLLIVSKTRSTDEIKTYYDLGHRDFGENRVQELSQKALELKTNCPDIRWHMLGPLQSNKVNLLFNTPNLYAIHSVHNKALVEKLIKASDKLNHPLHIFLQLNTSREEEKSGFESYSEVFESAELILPSEKLRLEGLMTMGTLRTENLEKEARKCFQELNTIKQKLQTELNLTLKASIGMSSDYKIALEEKSDWVRLGTRMFV
jgi:PLP dependent protein